MSAREAREKLRRKRERRSRRRSNSKIPTAGMADIAFLLLIFFMLIVYESDRTEVDLPDSTVRPATEQDAALVILALRDDDPSGVIILFNDGVSKSKVVPGFEAIEAEAARILESNRQIVFKIKADGKISARLVTRVFDALIGAGAGRVLMLTDPIDAPGGAAS